MRHVHTRGLSLDIMNLFFFFFFFFFSESKMGWDGKTTPSTKIIDTYFYCSERARRECVNVDFGYDRTG
jgi:hypothetical protein